MCKEREGRVADFGRGSVREGSRIAVVIPSFRVRAHVLKVIEAIGPEVCRIYVVDDGCPESSGEYVAEHCTDPRVAVIRHAANLGVGGAVKTGYRRALEEGMDIVVKIDGDGQMEPSLLPLFVGPIIRGDADYTKGNRFFYLEGLAGMPRMRLFGNAALSFATKLSSGYWHIFDPTNGYTAIESRVLAHLPLEKISDRYFFESDMLFRLNLLRAYPIDIPMSAVYASERSNLKIGRVVGEFFWKNGRNLLKRIFYNYFLRDMNPASVELLGGGALFLFGVVFGGVNWTEALVSGRQTPLGTIMLAALPVLVGVQLLLAFLAFDIANAPRRAIQDNLGTRKKNQAAVGL